MNFISDQFSSKDSIELEELNIKLPELNTQLEHCKKEVSIYLDSVQERLEEQPKRNKNHISAVTEINGKLTAVNATLNNILDEDLSIAENSYESLISEFNEVTASISVVHILCELHERLATLRTLCCHYRDYKDAVDVLKLLKVLVETLACNPSVTFIDELKRMVNKEVDSVNSLLKKEFQKNCIFNKIDNYTVIKVPENTEILNSLLPAIYKNNSTREIITTLPKIIWEKIFIPVIQHNCEIVFEKDDNFEVLRIEVHDVKEKVGYESVYRNIILIVEFLEKFLNCHLDDDLELLNYIGTQVKTPLVKLILDDCVLTLIPKEWRVVEKFKAELIKSTEIFEEKLKPYGMIDEEWKCIHEIEQFYTENRCKYFNEKCREIMKRDLHNVIEVGTLYDPKKSLLSDEFVRCSISSNIPELIRLGEELISEMCDGPIENLEDLYKTYKGIFFNYGDFVAAYHQKLLETIPQQVALFYNNCKFLFRQLSEWNEMFENHDKLNELCDDSSKGFYQVEEVGRMFFNSFVDEQKNQIETILKETNLQNKKTLDKLEPNTEKLLRQCLRQQELLKTVWSKVLSYPIYNETIGEIFNYMCSFLIKAIVKIEDIEAVVAENLIEIFKIVLNRGPKLFTDSNEVSLYVSQWYKFNDLIFVLGSSLVDINDRWADGKGPLALQFKPYELKQLIRALFQNTDRRAAVLTRIHE